MENLDAFLDHASRDGEVESESAHFTLSEERALAKLENVLEDRQQWVLKAVQAGVAGGCEALDFAINKNGTRVLWSGLIGIEAEQLRRALLSTEPTGEPFLDELVIGLRGLLGHCAFEFQGRGTLKVDQERNLSVTPQNCQETRLTVVHPGGQGLLNLWSAQKREAAAAQARFLGASCVFCPVPLRLDGREIQATGNRLNTLASTNKRQAEVFGLSELSLTRTNRNWELAGPPRPNPRFSLDSWDTFPVGNAVNTKSPDKAYLWCTVEYSEKGKSKKSGSSYKKVPEGGNLFWQRHGVTCAQESLYPLRGLGMCLALDASAAKTDLSGLTIGEKPLGESEARRLARDIWEASKPVLKDTVLVRHSFFSVPSLEALPSRLLNAVFGGFLGSVAILPFYLLIGWLLIFIPSYPLWRDNFNTAFILCFAVAGFSLNNRKGSEFVVQQAIEKFNPFPFY